MDTHSVEITPLPEYRYAFADSAVGRLVVVLTRASVVDVILGDGLDDMLAEARSRHPGASFVPDLGEHADWVAAIVDRFDPTARLRRAG